MTLTIELTPAQEVELARNAKMSGIEMQELVKRLIASHYPESKSSCAFTPIDRIEAMNRFAEKNRGLPVLSEAAFDREFIYEERL